MCIMGKFKNLVQKVCRFLPKGFLVFGVFSLFLIPLTTNAKEVIIWELDNWFSVEGGSSPDGVTTEFNIEKGDTVTFINQGATDHDAGNLLFITPEGDTFFDKQLFGGAAQSSGDTFTTDPIDLVGEVPFQCFIHGSPDMDGILVVSGGATPTPTPTGTDTPDPGKRFLFECDKPVTFGPAGIETLTLNVGETVSCVLKLTGDGDRNITNVVRGNDSVVSIVSDEETVDGELVVEIEGEEPGMVWAAWGIVKPQRGLRRNRFDKVDFDETNAWGFVIEVVDEE